MPCSDVTETIRLTLDEEDRLVAYALIKRTCGRAVGEQSLLGELLTGRPARELLDWTADAFIADHPEPTIEEEFLALKHLFAVQSALRALLGLEPGGAESPVAVGTVAYEGGNVVLEADIAVDVIVQQIKSCGRCKGCSAFAKVG